MENKTLEEEVKKALEILSKNVPRIEGCVLFAKDWEYDDKDVDKLHITLPYNGLLKAVTDAVSYGIGTLVSTVNIFENRAWRWENDVASGYGGSGKSWYHQDFKMDIRIKKNPESSGHLFNTRIEYELIGDKLNGLMQKNIGDSRDISSNSSFSINYEDVAADWGQFPGRWSSSSRREEWLCWNLFDIFDKRGYDAVLKSFGLKETDISIEKLKITSPRRLASMGELNPKDNRVGGNAYASEVGD
jgi:hypothetical protein